MVGLANGLDSPMEYETTHDIQKEIMSLLPGYYNLGQSKKLQAKPEAYLRNGYANAVQTRYGTSSNGKASRPFGLRMIQLLYHSGKLSTQASGLIGNFAQYQKRLLMQPEDLERLGLTAGDRVRVTSDQGILDLPVQGRFIGDARKLCLSGAF